MINVNIFCDCEESKKKDMPEINLAVVDGGIRFKCNVCGDEHFIKKSS